MRRYMFGLRKMHALGPSVWIRGYGFFLTGFAAGAIGVVAFSRSDWPTFVMALLTVGVSVSMLASRVASTLADGTLAKALSTIAAWVPVALLLALAWGARETAAQFTEFYSVSAQVIPVLTLALIIEMRVLERLGHASPETYLAMSIVLAGMFAGEFQALRALWGYPEQSTGWIIGALASASGSIILGAIAATLPQAQVAARPPRTNLRHVQATRHVPPY